MGSDDLQVLKAAVLAKLRGLAPLAGDAARSLRALANPDPIRVLCATAVMLGHDEEATELLRRLRARK